MTSDPLTLTYCTVDLARRRVLREDGELALTAREAELLGYLAARPGEDVAMDQLHREIWGHGPNVVSRAAFHTMRRLRTKVERDPGRPDHLLSVYGVGFRLVLPRSAVAPSDPPAPPSARLPTDHDAFVGRSAELKLLATTLSQSRLVTVSGFGGVGKTRLVRQFAQRTADDWPGGVFFCDLSSARDVHGIVGVVASALGVTLSGDPIVQLGRAISGRGRCLVVFDNFEQIAEHAECTLGAWLDRADQARLLVTSRQRLQLYGETIVSLEPLSNHEAVDLFVDRAARSGPELTLTGQDHRDIHELVRLLDGLPLAIELAAARLRVMTPRMLLARMSERFRLLSSGGGRPDRQATLRATLEWSWTLLSADEQSALAQLSVFEGGWTLAAAEAVLSLDSLWVPDALHALVDKSLVRRVSDERFTLLVSVHDYAAEQLDPAVRAQTEVQHGRHYASYGSDEAIERHGGLNQRRALGLELDNMIVAVRRAVGRSDGEVAAAALRTLREILSLHGSFALAGELANEVLQVESLSPKARAVTAIVAGRANRTLGGMAEARSHFEAALAIVREAGDLRTEGVVLDNLGNLHGARGRPDDARSHFEAALVIAREVGDRSTEGSVLDNLGNLHLEQGRPDEAREHYADALAIAREVGDVRLESIVLGDLGKVDHEQDRPDEAHEHYRAALVIARKLGSSRMQGVVLGNLGQLHRSQGRPDEAREHYTSALVMARNLGSSRMEGVLLANLGRLDHEQGRPDEAHEHYRAALVIGRELGAPRLEGFVLANLGQLHLDEGRLDRSAACLDLGEGFLRAVSDPVELGLLLCTRARLQHALGEPASAQPALAEAEALAQQVSAPSSSDLGRALTAARAQDGSQSAFVEGADLGEISPTWAPSPPAGADERAVLAGGTLGSWEVLHELGRGGMGVVYLARHRTLGHLAALKVLKKMRSDLTARLIREGRIAATLRHDNIVAVRDLLTFDGRPALLMEHVDGPDLATRLADGPLAPAQIDTVVCGICAGLGAAHASGVIHRDLKPGNVLLAEETGVLVAKVSDFGVAKWLVAEADDAGLTETGVRLGTRGYMAPELLRSARDADVRSDLYALGCVCYELVAGSPTFDADGRSVPIDQRAADAPRRWRVAIGSALQHDAADRPASVEAFLDLWKGSGA